MLRSGFDIAHRFDPALGGGMRLPVFDFTKTTAKTTTKIV